MCSLGYAAIATKTRTFLSPQKKPCTYWQIPILSPLSSVTSTDFLCYRFVSCIDRIVFLKIFFCSSGSWPQGLLNSLSCPRWAGTCNPFASVSQNTCILCVWFLSPSIMILGFFRILASAFTSFLLWLSNFPLYGYTTFYLSLLSG